ncbi:MAG: DUF4200 domain-containing protein [Wolbachia endosymbiont of Polyergus mexicanus]|uniref:DUF4200 domain-containing protein n=1 Tax=Wolbachia endosymbiont of Polyergus mexicanus TaxID=3171167 RepID=A0AAU7YH81_9RICK
MGNLYDKNNAPYLIVVVLATLTLLASGTLAVAPYIAFLSPIAAFNVALLVALSLSILSTLIFALSCKMIGNNKKIEVERNKFAEKEQELESVKQQLESKVQELENEITLGKEAGEAANKQEEQLNELTQEKQSLESEIEGLNKEIDQLKKQLTDAHQELNLAEQELTNIKQQLDDAIKELNNKDNQIRELEGKIRELNNRMTVVVDATSKHTKKLNNQLNRLTQEKKDLESKVKRLNDEKERLEAELKTETEKAEQSERKLAQEKKAKENLGREVKGLNNQLSGLTQEKQDLEGKIEELGEKIKSLNEQLNGAQQTLAKKKQELEQEREDFHFELEEMKNNHKTDMDKFKKQAEECLKDKEISVLSVVKERVEQGLSGSEEQQYMQDTDHIQEAVDKFMQPIYEKLGINNQLDISSEHSSGFEGTDENTSANKQFSKPKSPYISIPIRPPYTELNDASCDSGYFSGCSTSTNSYHTF